MEIEKNLLELFNIYPIEESNIECAICNEINSDILVSLKCLSGVHPDYVHLKCMWNWYSKEGDNCPFCRQKYINEANICKGFRDLISKSENDFKSIINFAETIGKYENKKIIEILGKIENPFIEEIYFIVKCVSLINCNYLINNQIIEDIFEKINKNINKDLSVVYSRYLKIFCTEKNADIFINNIEQIIKYFNIDIDEAVYYFIDIVKILVKLKPEIKNNIYIIFEKLFFGIDGFLKSNALYGTLKFFKNNQAPIQYTFNLLERILPEINEKTHVKILRFIEFSIRDKIWKNDYDKYMFKYINIIFNTNTELEYFHYLRSCDLAYKYEEYRVILKEYLKNKFTEIEWNIYFLIEQPKKKKTIMRYII